MSETPPPDRPRHRLAAWSLPVLAALAWAVSALRDPTALTLPGLASEDGRDIFAYYYNHPSPGAVFRSYNGYTSLLPNLAGWLALRLPVAWAPHALVAWALAASSLAFAWIARPAYRWLVPGDAARFVLGLTLALAPIGNHLFIGNTMYSIWSLTLLLVLQSCLAPPPARPAGAVATVLGCGLLIWSQPLSILLVPVWLLLLVAPASLTPGGVRPPTTRWIYGGYTALAVAYQWLGVEATSGVLTPRGWLDLRLTLGLTLDRVVVGSLLGDGATRWLRRTHGEGWVIVLALVILAAVAWVIVRGLRSGVLDRRELWVVAGVCVLCLTFTLLFVLTRDPPAHAVRTDRFFRYFWVQRALWLLTLFWLGTRLARRRSWRAGESAVATALLAAWLVTVNGSDGHSYRVNWSKGAEVAALVEEAARQEAALGGRRGVHATAERGIWTIELDRRPREDP